MYCTAIQSRDQCLQTLVSSTGKWGPAERLSPPLRSPHLKRDESSQWGLNRIVHSVCTYNATLSSGGWTLISKRLILNLLSKQNSLVLHSNKTCLSITFTDKIQIHCLVQSSSPIKLSLLRLGTVALIKKYPVYRKFHRI